MEFLDIFAGIGGFRSGMELAGHKCIGYIEKDKFARKSYEAIYNTKGEWTAYDVQKVQATEIPKTACWCFGFPCQDISVAGKQKGIRQGNRSSLFYAVTGLIKNLKEEDRPQCLFIENVKGLLSINRGFDFLRILTELDKIGYDAEWDVLDTAEVLPQHRERIYIIGHLRGKNTRQVFPIRAGEESNAKKFSRVINTATSKHGETIRVRRYACKKQAKAVVPVLTPARIKKRQNGRRFKTSGEPMFTLTAQDHHGILEFNKDFLQGITSVDDERLYQNLIIRTLTPLECWRLQGFTDEQFFKAKNTGISDSQLYKQAGNAASIPVVELIAKRL